MRHIHTITGRVEKEGNKIIVKLVTTKGDFILPIDIYREMLKNFMWKKVKITIEEVS